MILVSSCLAGYTCTYDDKNKTQMQVVELVKAGKALPVRPEQLGGLPTPREPAECLEANNKTMVITASGKDVTKEFNKGANEVLRLASLYDAKAAILKGNSPSCGVCRYDGSFSGLTIDQPGITAGLLMRSGITVVASDDEEGINKLLARNEVDD